MDVTIVIATYGDQEWVQLARERALPSAEALGAPVIAIHGNTLADARNEGLRRVRTEWVVFLDADDELEPGYLDAMATGTADLRAPAVRFVRSPYESTEPFMPNVSSHTHECTGECLPEGNWLVIGSMVRAELVRLAGGFEEWPVYEDWALWLRLWTAGATVEAIPEAIYRAYYRRNSRNRAPDMAFKNDVHRQIVEACGA